MPMNNHAVCIVGMPRSGTSLITHAALLAGVYLGRKEMLMPAMPNMNDEGFFELEEFLKAQQSILEAAGQGGWHSTEPLPEHWWEKAAIASGRETLARLVEREFSGVPLWGWKSPPTTILLPLWEELARKLGFSMRLVVSFRNPLDVARSLARIWNLPISQGLRLWAYYMLTVFDAVERHPHLFVQYDDFLADPEASAKRLGDFLGSTDAGLPQKVREIIRPGRRHSQSSLEELAAVADADIVALYQECLDRRNEAGSPAGRQSLRLLGSIEDYRQWSRLADFQRSDMFPISLDSAVIFDLGDEKDHVVARIIPYAQDGIFDEEFPLSLPGAQTVLFCPCPGAGKHFFRCRIEAIETDGTCQGVECKNPEEEENGWDVFAPGGKPFYKLAGDFSKATYVRIKGRIDVAVLLPAPVI